VDSALDWAAAAKQHWSDQVQVLVLDEMEEPVSVAQAEILRAGVGLGE